MTEEEEKYEAPRAFRLRDADPARGDDEDDCNDYGSSAGGGCGNGGQAGLGCNCDGSCPDNGGLS